MDNIDRMMKEADRLGFGVSYGKYRAAYPDGSGDVLIRSAEPEPVQKPTRKCRRCGKLFVLVHGAQAYCGPDCSQAATMERQNDYFNRKRRNEERVLVISCAECGADFRAVQKTQKYCCPECKQEGHRKLAAQWRAARRRKG